jgi:2'-5' RNA ligase
VTERALVAYPILENADRLRIEALRARHDPQASLIRAHFTLVFPADVPASSLVAHARTVLGLSSPIAFVVSCARAVPDSTGGGGRVYLVPAEGHREIVALHDRLYEGVLRPHLREDLPFVPHVTVGGCSTLEACAQVAEGWNQEQRAVRGTLRDIDVIEVGAGGLRSLAVITLGQAGRPAPAGQPSP